MIPIVDLKAQYRSIKQEMDAAISEVLESSQFVLGPKVEAFETEFAAYCQTRYAFGLNSGTSALHLALLAAGVGPGDEVITVSYTFVATVAAILYTGATPVLVDIDPNTCNIDVSKIEAAITPRTKVIMPVHLYGSCADMDPIFEIARRHNVTVIEDAAQAHGAEYKGKRAGSMGELACFSFYPGKNLGAYGEAGAIVTNNEKYVDIIRELRDQGQSAKYLHERVGYNYRMEAIQGAVLAVKLRHLDDWTKARRAHAKFYQTQLVDSGVQLLAEPAETKSVYHVFPLFTPERDQLREHLHANGVSTGIHYPIPVHLQTGFAGLGYAAGSLPETERVCRNVMSLPMYPELTLEQLTHITNSVRQFCSQSTAAYR
jgi:dTDP-4-amino-4,6-dideoxygalactose transaminase